MIEPDDNRRPRPEEPGAQTRSARETQPSKRLIQARRNDEFDAPTDVELERDARLALERDKRSLKEDLSEVSRQARDRTRAHAGAVADELREDAASIKQMVLKQARGYVDQGTGWASSECDTFADALNRASDALEEGGDEQVARYTRSTARELESARDYLTDREPMDMVEDLRDFARERPALFLGGLFAAGFAAGRFLSASKPRPRRLPPSSPEVNPHHQLAQRPVPQPPALSSPPTQPESIASAGLEPPRVSPGPTLAPASTESAPRAPIPVKDRPSPNASPGADVAPPPIPSTDRPGQGAREAQEARQPVAPPHDPISGVSRVDEETSNKRPPRSHDSIQIDVEPPSRR